MNKLANELFKVNVPDNALSACLSMAGHYFTGNDCFRTGQYGWLLVWKKNRTPAF